jgi:hypothetical protein
MPTLTETIAAKNVSFTPGTDDVFIGGSRIGTVLADKAVLVNLFGPPRKVNCGDEKVTMQWVFETPRGTVEVRDYWWNAPNEWSIAAANYKAAQWVIRFMRSLNLKAHRGR